MVKKVAIASVVVVLGALLLGVVIADGGSFTFVPAPISGEFDFNSTAFSVSVTAEEYDGNTTTLNVTYSGGVESKTLIVGEGNFISLADIEFEDDETVIFEAFVEGVSIAQESIIINPQAPTIGEISVTDNVIETQQIEVIVDITDNTPDGVDEVSGTLKWCDTCSCVLGDFTKDGDTYTKTITSEDSHAGSNTLTITAVDVYGNSYAKTKTFAIHDLLANDFAELIADDYIVLSGDLFMSVAYLGDLDDLFGAGIEYTFDLGETTDYRVYPKFSFANETDKITIASDELSLSDMSGKTGDLSYVAAAEAGFSLKPTSASSGKVCFSEAVPVDENKAFILYCSKEDISGCGVEDWSIFNVDSSGCVSGINLGSQFVLAKCADSYWDGSCHKEIPPEDGDDEGGGPGGGDDTAGTDKKTTPRTTPKDDKTAASNKTSGDGDDTSAEGGFLTGLGTFFVDNKNTTIPASIGAVLAVALIVFIVHRKRGVKTKDDKDKPSIHELAKKHDVHKPEDPKDVDKLKDFIEVAMMMGHNVHDLKDALKYRGWNPKTVDQVFKGTSFKDAKK